MATKILSQGLFTSIAPSVHSCDARLAKLEESQNLLMTNLMNLESSLVSLNETHSIQKKALPLLNKRTLQLSNIRKRMNKLHVTMETMAARVKNTEMKLATLPSPQRREEEVSNNNNEIDDGERKD